MENNLFTEFKKRYNDMKERGEKIISLLDGMRYENAIATLDWCKEKLDFAVIRSRDIFPDSADERAQAYLDEKALSPDKREYLIGFAEGVAAVNESKDKPDKDKPSS